MRECVELAGKLRDRGHGSSAEALREVIAVFSGGGWPTSSTGHWFQCPNGHPYVITECGGATVESTCPECGSRIGGGSHRLREDNSGATELFRQAGLR